MKYFNIKALNRSIERIIDGDNSQEHRTGTAALGLVRNYFPVEKFAITPEQIQLHSNKRPDLAIEKFSSVKNDFSPHCFVEVKSLVNSNITKILDQLHTTVVHTLDEHGNATGNYSAFMVGLKGTKIAFYVYHNFASLLQDFGINNYNGFIPLNYLIGEQEFLEFNKAFPLKENMYSLYKKRTNFNTDPLKLTDLGATSIPNFDHPHILDLLNEKHRDDIHNMFIFMEKYNPNYYFSA